MDPFLTNTRQFFQGLPTSTRGYDGSSLEDTTHAPPTPTPPATPTLPPAHAYYPYQISGNLAGAAPATSLPGQLPQSRPITPATPSHKPLDHTPAASPYSIPSFLHPPSSKPSANDSRYLSHLDHVRQVSAAPSSRSLNPLADARAPSRPYSTQPSLVMDSYASRTYSAQSTVSPDNLQAPRSYSTQAPSALESHMRPYGLQVGGKVEARYPSRPFSSQLPSTNDTRTHANPFSPPSLATDPRTHHLDNKYTSKADMRPDLRGLEIRPDPRPDFRPEHQWPLVCRAPEAKALERLATSVHITTAPSTVNGSKDPLYLGRRLEESSPNRHGDDSYRKTLQVNGSRDPLYANGSHTTYSAPTQRESSSDRAVDPHPKEDSALDLSVKTVRQTPDSTAPDPEKSSGSSSSSSSSTSPLNSVNSERLSHNDSIKCSSSSIPSTGPGKVGKGPSPVPKANPGIGAPLRATPPSHVPSPYGINGSPSLLPYASSIPRVPHTLPAAKRPGDPAYPENRTKLPRRSHSPASRVAAAVAAHQPPNAHFPAHLSDKMVYGSHKEAEQSRSLSLLSGATPASSREAAERRQQSGERRDLVADWRKDPSSLDRRVVKEAMAGRSDPAQERREAGLERRGAGHEKWVRNPVFEPGYPPAKPSEPFDPYRAWLNPSEQAGSNGERSKYSPGQCHTATSVPTTLPQQGSRIPPTQHPHPYSAYGRPPDRLPHTPYSQAAPTAHSTTPHQQVGMMPPSQGKLHQPYAQPGSSRVPHSSSRSCNSSSSNSNSIGSSSNSSSSHPLSTTSVTQLYTSSYPHTSQAAHHQQKQEHHRTPAQYSAVNYPTSAKGASTLGFPAPHQTYPYTHHRPESNLSLYPPKRGSQVSPHPASSPHTSVSPHPSASPHLSASPHPSASPHLSGSPHPLAASPRPGVSPHPSQQGRTPQSSPHPAQRLPTSSPAQLPSHTYPSSLPPSPYSTHQTTPPSRPSSNTAPPSHLAHLTHQAKSPGSHVPQPTSHPAPAQPHLSRPSAVNPPSACLSQYPEYPPQDHLSQTHPLSYPSHLPQGYTSSYLHHIQAATSAHTRAPHSSQPYPSSQPHPTSQLHPPAQPHPASQPHPSSQPYSSSQPHPSSQHHPTSQMHPPSSQHHPVSQGHPPPTQHHPPSSQPQPPTSHAHSATSDAHPTSQGHSSSSQPYPATSQPPVSASQLPSSTSQVHTSDAHTAPQPQLPTSQSYPYPQTHRVTPNAPDTSQATPHSALPPHSTNTSYSQASQTSQSTSHSTYAPSYSQANSHPSSTPSHAPSHTTHSQSYAPPHSSQSSHSTHTPVHSSQPSPSHSTQPPSSTNSTQPSSSTHSSCPPPPSTHTTQSSPSTQPQSSHSTQPPTSTHSTQPPASTPYPPPSTHSTQSPTYSTQSSSTAASYPPSSTHSSQPPSSTPTHPPSSAHSSQPPSSYPSPPSSYSSQPSSSTHSTQPPPSSAHIPSHSSHSLQTTAASSHPSHAPPHTTTVHSSYTPQAAHVPSHIPQPHHLSQAPPHLTHPPQPPTHPTYPTHPSQGPAQAPPHPSHPSQVSPHPSHHPHTSYTPAPPHPSHPHPHHYAQGYHHPTHPYPYLTQGHPHPSLTHPTPPTTQPSQTSPRPSPAAPHPPAHHLHPSHPYPQHSQSYYPPQPYAHSSQGQPHAPASHYPRSHAQPPSQPTRSHSSHSIPPPVRPHTPAQPTHTLYPPQPSSATHTPQPGHRPSPHTSQTHSAQAPPHHPHYPASRFPHPSVKMESVPGGSQYMGYMYPSSQYCPTRPDSAPGKGCPDHTAPQLPSPGPRVSQEGELSRVCTKGEQKSFDSHSAGMPKPDSWLAHPSSAPATETKEGVAENSSRLPALPPPAACLEGHKTSTVFEFREEDNSRMEQPQSSSKVLEPGKAALAEKLHKKIQRVESQDNLAANEGSQESTEAKKEVKPEENEWDSGFNKLLDDLASNPDTVTSKKSKTLARRYLQKIQIQEAIDNDLIALPTSYAVEEEEEDSEPEPPVKFRGKFKSIKDKKVERLILTYASHSDESATEMIPDEDASDFEEELKREIRSKDKRRGHHKKSSKNYESSGSEVSHKSGSGKKSGGRGRNKENKPNNKQNLDYSYSSSNSSGSSGNSSSDSSSSDSSDDSDSDDSDSDEELRPKRTKNQRGKKWDSESTDSEVVIPRRRTRGGYKSSSEEEVCKPFQKNKKRRKKQDSSDSDDVPLKVRRGKRKSLDSDDDEEYEAPRRGKKKGAAEKKQKKRIQEDSDEASEEEEEEEEPKKTRARKKKVAETKKSRSKRLVSESSSSDTEEADVRTKKVSGKRKKENNKKQKKSDDSSDNSDIPITKKSHSKTNIIVESDNSEDLKKSESEEKKPSENASSKEKSDDESSPKEKVKKDEKAKSGEEEEEAGLKGNEQQEEEEEKEGDDEVDLKNDSVVEKLNKQRAEELNREDVREMKAWLSEVTSDIKKQLGSMKEVALRHCWRKPQFGAGEDFLQGWQMDVKKYKEFTGRFPKKLCQAAKHQSSQSPSKGSSKKNRDHDSGKDSSQKQGLSSPAKNTRSRSGIIKTNMSVVDDDRLKVAARPEISSVMQRFFDKVLAESGNDCTKGGLSGKKFNLGPFSGFGAQRVPTGLTPTPSVAPSMMASDDSDLDSLASLRTDLPASDSIPVSRRSIASSLLKKFGRKYNEKRLNSLYLNKPRCILEATNKPQLLPTPGMPTTEQDLKGMSPDELKMATFFRRETVNNYRDNFEVIVTKNGINEFIPILYQSRTRNKTKQIQDAATLRSVFGSDIPPHLMKKVEEIKTKKQLKKVQKKEEAKTVTKEDGSPVAGSRASTPAGSLVAHGEEDDDSELRSERSGSVLGESSAPQTTKRARRKFRKFRSGFDYIRKKKKAKADDEATPSRKRIPVRRHVNWPEESRDVAAEVRSWVVNKGLGETVLHKAARLQYHDVVVYCAESPDFDINVRDNAGYTPLHEACNRGHLDIAQVLCAHGAHVNAPGYKGMRPLHEAVENGHGELARLLLAYGADPALTTYAGQTCLSLCADTQTLELMEGYMADLKGRPGTMWHFTGPARFFDPEEQGCDVFCNVPEGKFKVRESSLCPKKIQALENPEKTCVLKIEEVTQDSVLENIQKNTENLNLEEGRTTTEGGGALPCGAERSSKVLESIKKEVIMTEDQVEGDKEKEESQKEELERKTQEEEEEEESEESEVEDMTFMCSEEPLVDIYEVEGRPHRYCLLREVTRQLGVSRRDLIVAARTIETVVVSPEEFESRVYSCVLGTQRWQPEGSRVELIQLTAALERLLGLETVSV